ncbi:MULTISPECIES: hypothetical protein [Ralstonia solanacearum species complex]|uniref:hypothetical protein n=1 Tax=Ralstonia solanacearum species complex TaxID=3116862 RepID=UPI0018D056C3|nr:MULTISPECIES: hypothetical protein [Ralstonia solanacearum species complex]MDN3368324.1 hypothetical protein [Ralstonia pseudosolanacearum]
MRKIHFAWAALAMSGGASAQLPGMAEMQLAFVHDDLQLIGAQLAKLQAPLNAHTFATSVAKRTPSARSGMAGAAKVRVFR